MTSASWSSTLSTTSVSSTARSLLIAMLHVRTAARAGWPSTTDVATPSPAGRLSARSTTIDAADVVEKTTPWRPAGSPVDLRRVQRDHAAGGHGELLVVGERGVDRHAEEHRLHRDVAVGAVVHAVALADPLTGLPVGEVRLVGERRGAEAHREAGPRPAVALGPPDDHPPTRAGHGDGHGVVVADDRVELHHGDRVPRHREALQRARAAVALRRRQGEVDDGHVAFGGNPKFLGAAKLFVARQFLMDSR